MSECENMNAFCRPLNDNILAEQFVENILEIRAESALCEAANLIMNTEIAYNEIAGKSTFNHENYRSRQFRSSRNRKALHKQIFEELVQNTRLVNDEEIELGNGGALPNSNVVCGKQAYILIGLPASGKSGIANKISDSNGAIILDSDYVKRKLPEFKNSSFGASITHEESDAIIFRSEYNVLEYCHSIGSNIVIPKIGHNPSSIKELASRIKNFGYTVHLTLVSLDRQQSVKRAYKRFCETKRYVPLSLIFDGYANDPILTYYRIRNNDLFSSYGAISTDGDTKIIEFTENNPVNLFKL